MRHFLLSLATICIMNTITSGQTSSTILDLDTRNGYGSNPVNFTVFKNKVYFYASDSIHGTELWVTDGRTASIVADINPGPESCILYKNSAALSVHYSMQVIGDTLYFAAADSPFVNPSIYKYDGINPPTMVYDLHSITFPSFSPPRKFTTVGNVLYFIADTTGGNSAIMSYNPTTGIGEIVNTKKPNINTPLIPWKNKLLFCGEDPSAGYEFHQYDHTNSQTKLMVDYTVQGNTIIHFYSIYNNQIYIKATNLNGPQLYMFDGDSTIKSISFDTTDSTSLIQPFASVNPFCYYNNELYYSVIKNNKRHIYSYNPATGKKTYRTPVKAFPGASYLVAYKGKLYYNDSSSSIYDFQSSTMKLTDIYALPATTWFSLNHHIKYDDMLITAAFIDSARGMELLVLHDSTLSISNQKNYTRSIAYPNPSSQDAYLDLELNEGQNLSIRVSDINGRIVHTLDSKLYSQGKHTISLPLANMPAGTYFYSVVNRKAELLSGGKIIKQ